MHPLSRILVLAVLLTAAGATEPGNRPPLDESRYLDVPGWFSALPEDAQHLAPAAVVTAVEAGSPASAAGLAVGDRLIALAGRRVHMILAMIRLLRSAMSARHDQETWTVERGQERVTLVLAGLDPFRRTGATLSAPADDPDCVALLAPLGVAMTAADAQDLRLLPARISHAVAAWLASPSGARSLREAPWMRAWVATYLHVLRGEAVAAATMAVPEALLERVDRFHRAIAAHRAAGAPSCAAEELGCDPWFCALFYPYPSGTAPAFGTPTLSPPLAGVLRLLYDDPLARRSRSTPFPPPPPAWQPSGPRVVPARCDRRADRIPRSMIAMNAPPTTASRIGIRPCARACWRSSGAASRPRSTTPMSPGWRSAWRWRAQGAARRRSRWARRWRRVPPYLAARAPQELAIFLLTRRHGAPEGLAILAADAQRHPYGEPMRFPEIYEQTPFFCPTLARLAGGGTADARHGLPALYRARPELVAAGLERRQWSADRDRWTVYAACGASMNKAAWRIASRPPYADGEQALQCARMLLALTQGGEWLDLDTTDTVAACLARGGDFAAAVRIEQEAIAGLPPLSAAPLADFSKRLALYQQHQPAAEPRAADEPLGELVAARLTWPGGALRAEGHTCAGARIGLWRYVSASGALEATCNYWAGVLDGPSRSYHPDGTITTEAFFANGGRRVGRWRTWHEGGMLGCDGTYVLNGGTQQKCGEWLWCDASGRRLESGGYSYDQRVGPWSAWDLAGRRILHATFISGTPQPAADWPRMDELPAEPLSPEPAPATAAEFVAHGAARNRVYDLPGTLGDYTRAIELAPDLASAWAGRARARNDMNDHAGALSDANRAIALGAADATVYRIRAAALAGGGDRAGAERDFTAALALAPADRDARFGRGRSRAAAGDQAGAISDFTSVLALSPEDGQALFCRGLAYQAAGQAEAAIRDLTAFIASNPNGIRAYDHLAEIKAGAQDLAGAIKDLSVRIELIPADGEPYLRRGRLEQESGAVDDALRALTHAIAVRAYDPAGYLARGALLCDRGRLPEALADYRKVPGLLPPGSPLTAGVQLRLWLIRSRQGEGDAAAAALQGYLAQRPPATAPEWMLPLLQFRRRRAQRDRGARSRAGRRPRRRPRACLRGALLHRRPASPRRRGGRRRQPFHRLHRPRPPGLQRIPQRRGRAGPPRAAAQVTRDAGQRKGR